MKSLVLLALAFAGTALAQGAAPTPPACLATAGLEPGLSREAAFDMMRKRAPETKTANVKSVHFAPEGRPYEADVTFGSESADAKVTEVRFAYTSTTVLDEITERFGAPAAGPSPGSYVWHVERCKATYTYRPKQDEKKTLVGSEVTVTPLAKTKH
jgi:hypothetical protein